MRMMLRVVGGKSYRSIHRFIGRSIMLSIIVKYVSPQMQYTYFFFSDLFIKNEANIVSNSLQRRNLSYM